MAALLRVRKSWVYEHTRSADRCPSERLPHIKLGKYVRFHPQHVPGAPAHRQWRSPQFALLRPVAEAAAQERVRELVLEAYAAFEQEQTEAAS